MLPARTILSSVISDALGTSGVTWPGKITISSGLGFTTNLASRKYKGGALLDFWEFNGGKAPLKNYLGWIMVSFPLNCFYHILKIRVNGTFTHHLYILNILFFSILLLQLNTLKNLV